MVTSSFDEALRELLELASQSHDNTHRIQSLAVADEHGWLKDDDRTELAQRQAAQRHQDADLEGRVKRMQQEHRDRWRTCLDAGIAVFQAVRDRPPGSMPAPGRDLRAQEFDSLTANALIQAWEALRSGGRSESLLSWALAVGSTMRRHYEAWI